MYNYESRLRRILKHVVIWVVIVFSLFPIIWILSASLNSSNTLVGQNLIPDKISLDNYKNLFTNPQHPFGLWMWNTVKISLIVSFIAVFMTSLAAYAFARFRFKGRRNGLFTILLIQIFPQMLAMVAIYLLFLEIQRFIPWLGLNTHQSLIIVYLGGAVGVNTWLLKGYLDTIPRSLDEAAYIDGASRFQVYFRVIMPLARPILAVLFVLQFIGIYSEFILARILLSTTDKFTLAVGLQTFIADQYAKRWGEFSAAALLGAIPIVIVFFLSQKHIVSGLSGGAVKE